VLNPVTIKGSRPKLAASVLSYPPLMNACRPAYVTPTAVKPDATTLIFRRVRRRARKSFHVSSFSEPVAAELEGGCCAAAAPDAEDSSLIVI
jgi:hypothetical protein